VLYVCCDNLIRTGLLLRIFFSHGVTLNTLGTAATVWPIVPAPGDDDCGAIGGMLICRGN
jgi:hypothetical protein